MVRNGMKKVKSMSQLFGLARGKGGNKLDELITNRNWEEAIERLKQHPNEAKTRSCDDTYTLPLHLACSLQPTVEMIMALLDVCPEAAEMKHHLNGRLPLHTACLTGACSEVISELLVACFRGVGEKDGCGRLPIHFACGRESCTEVISLLLKMYPKGARIRDEYGWLPIHVACVYEAPEEAIMCLLDAFPESSNMTNFRGKLPIECIGMDSGKENESLMNLIKSKSAPCLACLIDDEYM